MPSAANTALARYELTIVWRDGRRQVVPMKYHEHISIGPDDGADRGEIHLGPRDHRAKVVVHVRGDELPTILLRDTAAELSAKDWAAKRLAARRTMAST